MKISTAQTVIKTNIESQVKGDYCQPLIISGRPGISKSAIIKQIAKDNDYNIVIESLPALSSENLSGLPQFSDAPDMTQYSTVGSKLAQGTEWTVPMMILEANRLANDPEKKGCVLLLDDIHLINMSTAPYFYSLLEERSLGSYRLDSRVAIVGTMNNSDEAGFEGMQSPIKDRASILPVEFDFENWYELIGKTLNFKLSSFIKLYPHYLEEEESIGIEQFLTPRSATYFGVELDNYSDDFILKNAKDLALMKMSKNAAITFTKHIEYLARIDFSNLVKKRADLELGKKEPIDEILYAYIVNYIVTKDDAAYLCSLIDKNIEYSNFIGFLSGELYNKSLLIDEGKQVTAGIKEIIKAIMKPEKSDLVIENRDRLYELIVEFM